MIISIDQKLCPQNHSCPALRICPVSALSQSGYNAPKVDMDKCIKCKKCTSYCPTGAIKSI